MDIAVVLRTNLFFYGSALGIDPMNNELVRANMLSTLNPYDESALMVALRQKDSDAGSRVSLVVLRSEDSMDLLDKGLALGADEGIVLETGKDEISSPEEEAYRWTMGLKEMDWQVLLVGRSTIDTNEDTLGVYLGEYLGLPVVSGIKQFEQVGENKIRALRKLEKGHGELVECDLPAVLTVERTSSVRYPTLRNIAKPKKKVGIPVALGNTQRLESLRGSVTTEGLAPPKARPKKGVVEVDTSLSVSDKLSQLFSGGVIEKKDNKNELRGSTEELARGILRLLIDKGFIGETHG